MDVQKLLIKEFKNQLKEKTVTLNNQETQIILNNINIKAIQNKIEQELESSKYNRRGYARTTSYDIIIKKHSKKLKLLAKQYANIFFLNYIKHDFYINDDLAKKTLSELKCDVDAYPCKKEEDEDKGMSIGFRTR